MPTPTPSPVVRIRLIHGLGTTNNIGCRIFYSYTDAAAPSIADLNTLAASVATRWGTNLAGLMSSSGGLTNVIIDDLASAAGNEGTHPAVVSGTRAGLYFDVMQAVVVNFKIGPRYRGGKPKIFLPYGIVTDAESNNVWAGAFVTAVQTQWAAFIAALNGLVAGGITLGSHQSVSYFHGPTQNTNKSPWARRNVPMARPTPVVNAVLAYSVQNIVSNQRRRAGR